MVYWWNPHTYIAMIYWWTSSSHGRHWDLGVLPKDTKWQWRGSNPWWEIIALPTELPLLPKFLFFGNVQRCCAGLNFFHKFCEGPEVVSPGQLDILFSSILYASRTDRFLVGLTESKIVYVQILTKIYFLRNNVSYRAI